jgi:hypothetical protein
MTAQVERETSLTTRVIGRPSLATPVSAELRGARLSCAPTTPGDDLEQSSRPMRLPMYPTAFLNYANAYHADSKKVRGRTVKPGREHWEWINISDTATPPSHPHHETAHNCKSNGGTTQAESHVLVGLRSVDARAEQGEC